jgi:hypothetical protein
MKVLSKSFKVILLSGFFSIFLFSGAAYADKQGNITEEKVKGAMAKLQVPFIENRGRHPEDVRFYSKTFGGTLFVTKDGNLVYSLPSGDEKGVAIKEELINAKVKNVKGEDRSDTKVNYFKGSNPSEWNSNIQTYGFISLGEVYDGIELKLKAYGNNVEKLFHVKSKANPEDIKIKIDGAEEIRVNEKGELELKTTEGTIKFTKPIAYQEINGKRRYVDVAYLIEPTRNVIPAPCLPVATGDSPRRAGKEAEIQGTNVLDSRFHGNDGLENSELKTENLKLKTTVEQLAYSFKLGDYDKTKEIVIDPLLASTYLGGSDWEYLGWPDFFPWSNSGFFSNQR